MARAYGSRAQMALAFESVYGTAPTPPAFWKMPFASTTLSSEQPLLGSELLGYGRDPIDPVKDAITADGDVVIPIDARFAGIWLKLLMGEPTTTGTDPYTHVFQSGSYNLPSASIEVGMPEIPNFAMSSGVKGNQISWQMQRSGLVTATMGLIAQGEAKATSTAAGTLAEMDMLRFGSFNGSIKREGTQLANVVSGQITYSNNLDRIETIRSDGKIDGADPTMAMLSGNIVTRFADNTLIDQAIAGTPCELEFVYTNASAGMSLTLTAHRVFLPVPRRSIEGPGGVQATFDWQAALDSTEGCMCTATLINDVEDYDNVTS